jgi:predicted Zn-dependent peptidase
MQFRLLALGLALALLPIGLEAQDLATFEKTVTEHPLPNGMKFIIVERHEVPVVSFQIYADVGSVNEEAGISGMAHMFEHMAFKGTSDIGTKDIEAEKLALAKVDEAYAALQDEQRKGTGADPARLEELAQAFAGAKEEAAAYVESNEYTRIIEESGGVGLNAGTGFDSTAYYVSFPSNKLELWFSLESARFLDPVFREFYKERDVVIEERRVRVENQPIGKLMEEYLAVAYKAHPYGRNAVGWMSDLANMTREQAKRFFRKHYTPSNLTAAIVGDVDPEEAIRLAELYFGRIPKGPRPPTLWTEEPPQDGERRLKVHARSQPALLMGYHKPSVRHPDDAVFDAVQDILSGGRTSRIYRSLVRDKKIAISAGGFPGFPGVKYPNQFLFFAFPTAGHTNEENEKAMLTEIERLKTELVTDEELSRVTRRARADLIGGLDSNGGLADQLLAYEVLTGDWRNLFHAIDAIEKVTREDIQRVAKEYFNERNRTVGYLIPDVPAQPSGN